MKKTTRMLSLVLTVVIAVSTFFTVATVSSAAGPDQAVAALGINTANSNGGVECVADPLGSGTMVAKLATDATERRSYAIAKDGGTYELQHGHTYKLKFEVCYYPEDDGDYTSDFKVYRATETGGQGRGYKSEIIGTTKYVKSVKAWQTFEIEFTADLKNSPEYKYLLLTKYTACADATMYIRNITVEDLFVFTPLNTNPIANLDIVDDPVNSGNFATNLALAPPGRICYGIAQNGNPYLLQDGHWYTMTFDVRYTGGTEVDLALYRSTETGGKATGNKTQIMDTNLVKPNLQVTASESWQSKEISFKVDLNTDSNYKYLVFSALTTDKSSTLLVKNVVIKDNFGINKDNSNGNVTVVKDPGGSGVYVMKLAADAPRYSFAISDEAKTGTYLLRQGRQYKLTFDVYIGSSINAGDITLYRATDTGGSLPIGDKTEISDTRIYLSNLSTNTWVTQEITFTANLRVEEDRKYLLLTNNIGSPCNLYIKNLAIEDLSPPETGIQSLEVDENKSTLTYYIGDTTIDGLYVTANYVDGTSQDLGSFYTTLECDTSTVGKRKVAVFYGNEFCNVEIEVKMPSVTLSDTSLTLAVGETQKLTATSTEPKNYSVLWKSNNPSVAEVSPDGTVTAVSAGIAEIAGFIKYNGKKYETICKVTVTDTPVGENDPQLIMQNSKVDSLSGYFTVYVSLKNVNAVNYLGISNIRYDTSELELISAEWLIEGTENNNVVHGWDAENARAAITFESNYDQISGGILNLTFKRKKNCQPKISCDVTASYYDDSTNADTPFTITVMPFAASFDRKYGDVNGDGVIDSGDVKYLLYEYVFGAKDYPLYQDYDFNGDKTANDTGDVEYLLLHTLFPEYYELHETNDSSGDISTGDNTDDKDQGFGEWIPF